MLRTGEWEQSGRLGMENFPIYRAYNLFFNNYFVPIRSNISHATPSYGPEKSNYNVDYYRQKYCNTKQLHIWDQS